jgi:hypothetical protein
MSTITKTSGIRRALMASVFAVAGVLTIGAATAPANAQYYPQQYMNPYYSNNPYQNQYQARHAYWQWRHEYWRWYHQYNR